MIRNTHYYCVLPNQANKTGVVCVSFENAFMNVLPSSLQWEFHCTVQSHEQKTHAVLHGYKLVVGLKIIQLWKWPKCASVASPFRKNAIGVLSLIGWFISDYIRVSSSHWHKRHLTWGMSWEQEQMLLELKHNSSTRWHCASLRGHWGNPQHMCGSFRNFLQAQRYTSVPSFSYYEQAPM